MCYHIKTKYNKTKTRRHNGFTFIELLIVLSIISILLVLSVTSWNRMIYQQEHSRFPMAFRWLLTEARQKAISENRTVRIFVDWENKTMEKAKTVAWLQLPCTRGGGSLSKATCPSEECLGANVYSSSCVPISRSEKLLVPENVRLPNDWGDLCFLAGSGRISVDCKQEIEIPPWIGLSYKEVKVEGRRSYKFYLNPIASYIELTNCNTEEGAKNTEACL